MIGIIANANVSIIVRRLELILERIIRIGSRSRLINGILFGVNRLVSFMRKIGNITTMLRLMLLIIS